MPLFSIIIPTYNAAATLATALESVAQQSFRDVEVLVQDGGSLDNTLEIAHSFQDQLPGLIIKSEADTGIYDAMNKAVIAATGTYIYFLGSDDHLYDAHTLATIAKAIQQAPVDVMYGDVHSPRFKGRYDGPFTAQKIVLQNICHQAMFMHKNVFDRIGLFDVHYPAQADWHHNMRWVLDTTISRQYVDLVIAHYADGGFSSINNDIKFRMHKGWLGYKWGKSQLPLKLVRDICMDSLTFSKQQGNTWWTLRYQIMITLVKIKLKLKRLA
ncbi:MAG: glycosyltransferase family 2 protein [Dokdonia sp.]|jgi:glycosyltransferase involved in cell wall biosynthesis